MKLFYGVDPAYSKPTAWCCVDEDGLVVSMGKSEAPWGPDVYAQATSQLVAALPSEVMQGHRCHIYGAVEGQYLRHNPNVTLQLSRAAALWEAALYTIGVGQEVWRPKPSQWRSKLPGVRDKASAKKYAAQCGWDTDCDDEAEALCIALAARRHYGAA